jgi:hypothetical protein
MMSASLQTCIALGLVALAALLLVRSWFGRRGPPGCGANCGAVSPEVRKLQKRLKHRP